MKRFIALGLALMVLLFSFIPSVDVANLNEGIRVCSNLEPQIEPYD